MSKRKPVLPKKCECGGNLTYQFGPGDYIWPSCDKCMPVVTVKLPVGRARP